MPHFSKPPMGVTAFQQSETGRETWGSRCTNTGSLWNFRFTLWQFNIAIENHHCKSVNHHVDPFSIAMLVITRGFFLASENTTRRWWNWPNELIMTARLSKASVCCFKECGLPLLMLQIWGEKVDETIFYTLQHFIYNYYWIDVNN